MAKWKTVKEELTLSEALEFANSELRELADEMEEWASNMEGTNLEYTERYERVRETADILEEQSSNLEDVVSRINETSDTLDLSTKITVTYTKPYSKYESRPTRLSRVISYLEACKDELESQLETIRIDIENLEEEIAEDEKKETPPPELEQKKNLLERNQDVESALEDAINELDDIIGELESVEFPTMYG